VTSAITVSASVRVPEILHTFICSLRQRLQIFSNNSHGHCYVLPRTMHAPTTSPSAPSFFLAPCSFLFAPAVGLQGRLQLPSYSRCTGVSSFNPIATHEIHWQRSRCVPLHIHVPYAFSRIRQTIRIQVACLQEEEKSRYICCTRAHRLGCRANPDSCNSGMWMLSARRAPEAAPPCRGHTRKHPSCS
jgi:hypothetical protein